MAVIEYREVTAAPALSPTRRPFIDTYMEEKALLVLAQEIEKIWKVVYGDRSAYDYLPKRPVKKFDYYIDGISFDGKGREGIIYAHLYDKNGDLEISADLPYIINKMVSTPSKVKVRNLKYYIVACNIFQSDFIRCLKGVRANTK